MQCIFGERERSSAHICGETEILNVAQNWDQRRTLRDVRQRQLEIERYYVERSRRLYDYVGSLPLAK